MNDVSMPLEALIGEVSRAGTRILDFLEEFATRTDRARHE
jgi:hypothetical protein